MEYANPKVRPMRRIAGQVPLMRLRSCECKWPDKYYGRVTGGHLFCGRATGGHSYCANHRPLMFRPKTGIGLRGNC